LGFFDEIRVFRLMARIWFGVGYCIKAIEVCRF
jgi:hypothetical protein